MSAPAVPLPAQRTMRGQVKQGVDPVTWRADARAERINFTTGLLTDTLAWTNRPTFHQIMSFKGHRKR